MMLNELFDTASKANAKDIAGAANADFQFPKYLKGNRFSTDANLFEKPNLNFIYSYNFQVLEDKENIRNTQKLVRKDNAIDNESIVLNLNSAKNYSSRIISSDEFNTKDILSKMTVSKVCTNNELQKDSCSYYLNLENKLYLFSESLGLWKIENSLENLRLEETEAGALSRSEELRREEWFSQKNGIRRGLQDESFEVSEKPVPVPSTLNAEYEIQSQHFKDPRTTCMIKNIPNNYSIKVLEHIMNQTHKGKYDFLYLRMDFEHRCNAGYAFVNFKSPDDVITFYNRIDGKKWTNGLSKKIARLTYARIQGFARLVEKFKNSSIHEKEKIFQPKIFYTSGPNIGKERNWDDFRTFDYKADLY